MPLIAPRQRRSQQRRRRKRRTTDVEDEEEEDEGGHAKDNLSFWELFKENCTIHGLKDFLVAPRKDLIFIWAFLLIVAAFATFHGCHEVIADFLVGKVVVSYFVRESESLLLPDVVICPFNRLNRSFLDTHNVSEELIQYIEMSYPGVAIHTFQEKIYRHTYTQLDRLESEMSALLKKMGNISFTQFIKQAALSCDTFFQDKHLCRDATELFTSAGKCFRIPGKLQENEGYGNGMKLVLNIPTHLYHLGANQWANDGVAIKLVEHSTGIDNDISFVPLGSHALVPLTATRYEFLNDPPRYMCEDNPDPNYSRVWCYEKCVTADAEAKCNCSLAASTQPRTSEICDAKTFFDCFVSYMAHDDPQKVRECKRGCKAPCEYWSYGKTISYATFPSQGARAFVDEEGYKKLESTIVIEIFYTALEHTIIKHYKNMPLSSAIAQVGGQLSLWTGASVMSLMQLFIYNMFILRFQFSSIFTCFHTIRNCLLRLCIALKFIRSSNRAEDGRSTVLEVAAHLAEEEVLGIDELPPTSSQQATFV